MLVSVLIVNFNGATLLPGCLAAVAGQQGVVGEWEVVLVDNGSTDGSVEWVREHYPAVRMVEAGRNLGFAGGNNLAAQHAHGEWLALLNTDAIAEPTWLARMLAAAAREGVGCVAAKLLNGDGTRVDFAGGTMNLDGWASQRGEGWEVAAMLDKASELLFACGGAMLIRRDKFLALGGFDESFIAYFEDVDLGWRLWLRGERVWYEPRARVRHLGHATAGRFPIEQRYALWQTNALRMVLQNFEEASLVSVLPLALLMAARRAVEQGGLDLDSYRFGTPRAPELPMGLEAEPAMSRVATGLLVGMARVADELPEILARREVVQAARVRTDAELFSRFPLRADHTLFPLRTLLATQQQLLTSLEVPPVLTPRFGHHLLLITDEPLVPGDGQATWGIWELAHALADEFSVSIAAPAPIVPESTTVRFAPYDRTIPQGADLIRLLGEADVVLAPRPLWEEFAPLRNLGKPTVVLLDDPLAPGVLEGAARGPLLAGDLFLCGSERQRDVWLGALLAAGRRLAPDDPNARRLVATMPRDLPLTPDAAEPLRGFLRTPMLAPDASMLAPRLYELEQLRRAQAENARLRAHLDAVRGGRVMRLLNALGGKAKDKR